MLRDSHSAVLSARLALRTRHRHLIDGRAGSVDATLGPVLAAGLASRNIDRGVRSLAEFEEFGVLSEALVGGLGSDIGGGYRRVVLYKRSLAAVQGDTVLVESGVLDVRIGYQSRVELVYRNVGAGVAHPLEDVFLHLVNVPWLKRTPLADVPVEDATNYLEGLRVVTKLLAHLEQQSLEYFVLH